MCSDGRRNDQMAPADVKIAKWPEDCACVTLTGASGNSSGVEHDLANPASPSDSPRKMRLSCPRVLAVCSRPSKVFDLFVLFSLPGPLQLRVTTARSSERVRGVSNQTQRRPPFGLPMLGCLENRRSSKFLLLLVPLSQGHWRP